MNTLNNMAKGKSPGVIVSLFKRVGGEGEFTKIITEQNEADYAEQLSDLEENEKGLIIYRRNNNDWFLLTNKRLISVKDDNRLVMAHEDVIEVEVERDNIGKAPSLTRVAVTDKEGKQHGIQLERGQSFSGIIQVLYFIVRRSPPPLAGRF
ncbi:hypothetical protein SAMN05518672_11241 [Chitinophaga sp. CF118]|uniref:hypothetical protein n=1 Tax=Chitinophaga sp. CF118 TaxID=1884367 RepID=UPI0008ECF9C0|nr:hypothetical protein [Chitinophaga sp. CF118]SFE91627.1 hypothetical protein SAMN05518672_11241 [Chitinophaga sp. CF118]